MKPYSRTGIFSWFNLRPAKIKTPPPGAFLEKPLYSIEKNIKIRNTESESHPESWEQEITTANHMTRESYDSHDSGGFLRKSLRGDTVFFRSFSARLAKIKTPLPGAFRKFLVNNFVYAA